MAEKPTHGQDSVLALRATDRGSQGADGNLVEAPLWRLDKASARPKNKDGSINLKEYRLEREWVRRGPRGEEIQQKVIFEVNPHHGYPTMLGNRIMHALLREAERLKYASPVIPASIADICKWLEVRPNDKWYDVIVRQLFAMADCKFLFVDSWMVIEKGRRVGSLYPGIRPVKLIKDFRFKPLVRKGLQTRQKALGFDGEDWVEIGPEVFESAQTYRVPLDLQYMNKLKGGVAQRLYEYLEKRNYGKPHYQERLAKLVKRLPLATRTPWETRETLAPALEQLKRPNREGKRLLADYRFLLPDGRNEFRAESDKKAAAAARLWVAFARAPSVGVAARLRARAEGRPEPQLEFDEFFYPDDDEPEQE
jgi:hypothetical protein